MQLFSTGTLGQPVHHSHKNLIAFRVGIPQFGKKAIQDYAIDADFRGQGFIGKKGVLRTCIMYNLNFIVDRKLLNRILGNVAVFAFFTQAIALVALLIRNAAGTGSLFGFAGRSYEPLPILLFLRGDFDPLAERAVVDLRGGLIAFF